MTLRILKGISLSKGIGIGVPYLLVSPKGEEIHEESLKSVATEVKRYHKAIALSIADVESLQKQLTQESAFEAVAVLEAHKQMLHDPLITEEVEDQIRKTKKCSLTVLSEQLEAYRKQFAAVKDPILQERFQDIKDVADRVKAHLQKRTRFSFDELPQDAVIFAHEVTPTEVAQMRQGKVLAIVTRHGTLTSHAAIIAKAKGLPFISGIDFDAETLSKVKQVIVDARGDEVILNPDQRLLKSYRKRLLELVAQAKALDMKHEPSVTRDAVFIRLSLNIGSNADLLSPQCVQADGVGLYRTEFLLEAGRPLPTEDEQAAIYSEALQHFQGRSVVVRLFDFGGDKDLPGIVPQNELNPALGLRAIRLLIKEKKLLSTQLKALVRADLAGNMKILLPMVSTLRELDEIRELIRKISGGRHIPLGCMVEVPSTALMADLFAAKVDFLSIGTNDLSQFVMGADRTNPSVSHLYTAHHPSVLRLIEHVVKEADKRSVPVSICGEIAADARFTPLLLGLGLRELSVHAKAFAEVRSAVRATDIKEAARLAKMALQLEGAEEVERLVASFAKKR